MLNFTQDERKAKIVGVPLTTIRKDWNLKSTFFSVVYYGDKVVLEGKGYGHGVGLSQEGAIRMVELGIPYKEILVHYYTGAKVVRLGAEEEMEEPVLLASTTAADNNVADDFTNDVMTMIAMVNDPAGVAVEDEKKKETKKVEAENTDKSKRSSDLASRMLNTKKQLEKESSASNNVDNENGWVYEW